MRIKKLLKTTAGMTIIEVLIALLLFTIITTSVTTIMVPTLTAYRNANDLAEVSTLANDVAAGIISSLEQATSNVVLTDPDAAAPNKFSAIEIKSGSKTVSYRVKDGLLQEKTTTNKPLDPTAPAPDYTNTFDEKYYKRKKVAAIYEASYADKSDPSNLKNPTYTITVVVMNSNDSVLFNGVFSCRPMLLNQY